MPTGESCKAEDIGNDCRSHIIVNRIDGAIDDGQGGRGTAQGRKNRKRNKTSHPALLEPFHAWSSWTFTWCFVGNFIPWSLPVRHPKLLAFIAVSGRTLELLRGAVNSQ